MKTKAIKLILNKSLKKTSLKEAKKVLRDNNQLTKFLRTVARDRDFKDFAILISTSSILGGALLQIFIKNDVPTFEQVQDLSDKVDNLNTKLEKLTNTSPDRSLDSRDEQKLDSLIKKIIKIFEGKGIIVQDGNIETSIIESDIDTSEKEQLENENTKLKKQIADRETTIRKQQIGMGIGAVA